MIEFPAPAEEIARSAAALSVDMPGGRLGPDAVAAPIRRGGSDRAFFRISEGGRSAVLLVDRSPEFEYYVSIGRFLRDAGVGVPEFYGMNEETGMILMEDLGSTHLEDALRGADEKRELALYRSAIALLVRLQTRVTERMMETRMLESRTFDREVLIGETDYFRAQFIDHYCSVELGDGWEGERNLLAELISRQPAVFMHRDLQCRNILLKDGELRLIDFQTAHRGPMLYDAASLLRDPYHPLPAEKTHTLAGELYDLLREEGFAITSRERFREDFVIAGIQRNLQALAAFVKLGTVKGKREFLDSIPAGLDLLEAGIDESGRFPSLKGMVTDIREKLEKGT